MLLNMHIRNIALIDEIDIGFFDLLNILTGETGAGKSIIIGSLGIGTGGKFQKELLRDVEKDGFVELLFSIDQDERIKKNLEDCEVCDLESDEVLISRRLMPNGRVINRINGESVSVAKIREVSACLIDLHAQHEQQSLLKATKHLEILDRFGGAKLAGLKDAYKEIYNKYVEKTKQLEGFEMDEIEKNKRMDYLQYQIQELENASLKVGEDEELEALYHKMSHAKEIVAVCDEVYQITGYERQTSCGEQIGHGLNQLLHVKEYDEDLADCCTILQDIDSMLSDFNRELKTYMQGMEFDEETFLETEKRLDLINMLKVKHGNSIEAILKSLADIKQEYEGLLDYEESLAALKSELKQNQELMLSRARELSDCRKTTAAKMCEMIRSSLEELNFLSVQFDMHFEEAKKCGPNGMDEAYFMISTNVGEPMKPLFDVASGGELSRVMLAIKSCLANEDETPTLVFDEIDVGISGRTAQKVAEKMSVIAKNHQVICITHLPQIAAMADAHYLIEKTTNGNKTVTGIRKLTAEEECEEIARMLGGVEITESTMASAIEMKQLAKEQKAR